MNVGTGICGATATTSIGRDTTNNTTSDSSSWLTSLDFLRTINLNTMRRSNNTTSTKDPSSSAAIPTNTGDGSSSSSLNAVYDRLGAISNQLVFENRLVTAISKQVTESFQKNLQFTATGVFLGAILGAAVATGVMIGMMATTTAIANSEYLPTIYSKMVRFWNRKALDNSKSTAKRKEERGTDSTTPTSGPTASHRSSTCCVSTGSTVIVQGNIPPSAIPSSNPKEQCEACLEEVANTLNRHGLTWMAVQRVTAYLVSGKCDAPTFRTALQDCTRNSFPQQQNGDYNGSSSRTSSSSPLPLVSIVFVQQLEQQDAMLQIEVIASDSEDKKR